MKTVGYQSVFLLLQSIYNKVCNMYNCIKSFINIVRVEKTKIDNKSHFLRDTLFRFGRESTGELPRPRSYSPKKKPAQPSLTGSSLSARIERASTVRASKNSPASQPPLPPPRTRARFSAKVCDGASSEEEKAADADATNLTAENDNKVMTNTHELTNSSASLTVETDSSGHDDTTPVVVLPPAIAAKACDDATECKMRRSPEKRELGHDQQKHRRSALLNTETEVAEKPPSPNTIMVTAASVFGIDSSQIRTSPHYLVPKKLSQSPVGWKPRAVEATKTKLGW